MTLHLKSFTMNDASSSTHSLHVVQDDLAGAPTPKIWSAEAWRALAARIYSMTQGGGETRLNFTTEWAGNVRWARNHISTSGDRRNNTLTIGRSLQSEGQYLTLNQVDEASVRRAMAYVEAAIARYRPEVLQEFQEPPFQVNDYLHPRLWFDATDNLDGAQRAACAEMAIHPAEQAGMVSAGYLEVKASGVAVNRQQLEMALYYPVTEAQYSVTVRDPQGTASGWAGVNWNDWRRIDVAALSAIALDKCLKSRSPVAIEPGRYTTILEPQAGYDMGLGLVIGFGWKSAIETPTDPYHDAAKVIQTKLGQRVVDERLTVRADPMDPDLGFVPFDDNGEPYQPAVWIERGVLRHLSYNRRFAVTQGVGDVGLLNSGNFRLEGSGPPASVDEMIVSTKRGLLVTRFTNVRLILGTTMVTGSTRDGIWLIENGKISKAVKNFRFTESPFFVLNSVEAIGVPQRVFSPGAAAMVPPLKVIDFSFTSLTDAV